MSDTPPREDDLFTAGRPVSDAQTPDEPANAPYAEGQTAAREAARLSEGARATSRREPEPDHDSFRSFLKELPVLLLIAFGLAFLLRTFVVQVFYIPSESMVPTLEVNDRIVVEKVSYYFREPERGEVVVFAGEAGFPTDATGLQRVVRGVGQFLGVVPVDARDLVKRIIGLPGDQISITDGVVSVNGEELEEPYARLDDDDGTFTVPEGELFVMGDNRARSADSRSSLGTISQDDVVGRAVVKIWPFDRFGSIEGADHSDVPGPDAAAPLVPFLLPAAALGLRFGRDG